MKRIDYIDQLKAISIFLIVYGHNHYSSGFADFLSSFRLPLFFIISGFVGKDKRALPFGDFMIRMAKRLLVPYFVISSLLYLNWFLITRHFGESALENYDPIKNLIGVLYSQGGVEYMNWGMPMWFLPALFCVSLIDFMVSKVTNVWKGALIFVFPLLGYFGFEWLGFHLPWSMDVAMVVYPFYFMGTLLKKLGFAELYSGKAWLAIVICLSIHVFAFQFNEPVSFYYGEYGFLPLTYLTGIVGTLWIFLLIKELPINRGVSWVGRNTLLILAFHLSAMTVIKAILLFGFGQEVTFTLWNSFLYSALQLLLLVPVILVINRYFPILSGWRAQKTNSETGLNMEK
jgi:fucose 4-O-acetylase-like acetyltransferase